jgi:hypothetical protein
VPSQESAHDVEEPRSVGAPSEHGAARAGEVLVVYVDAGGGHRNAAQAIAAAARELGVAWEVRALNLQDVFAPLDHLQRLTGLTTEDVYNLLLRRRLTILMVPLLRLLHLTIRLRRRTLVRYLAAHLRAGSRPLAVVSVMPNFNGVIRDACQRALPGVPFTVVLTDYADFPPRFWIEPGLERVVVGSDEAARQAAVMGVPAGGVFRASGMILHPRHYANHDRLTERRSLGMSESDFVVLVVFGGKGSPEMVPIARGTLAGSAHAKIIAVCGDNPGLVRRLESLAAAEPHRLKVYGFTDRLPAFLTAADLLVTKPGPGSLAEAFNRGVPVVVAHSMDTIPQERFNLLLVRDWGVGLVERRWADVPRAVCRLAEQPGRLKAFRERLQALPRNRAAFEVVERLDRDAAHLRA